MLYLFQYLENQFNSLVIGSILTKKEIKCWNSLKTCNLMDYPNKMVSPLIISEYFGGKEDYEREV